MESLASLLGEGHSWVERIQIGLKHLDCLREGICLSMSRFSGPIKFNTVYNIIIHLVSLWEETVQSWACRPRDLRLNHCGDLRILASIKILIIYHRASKPLILS